MSETANLETTENHFSIDATYSPEDNKLRLYSLHRLDDEIYQRVKEAGFKWAPKQELFVAPMWTPARENLCIELAGSIEAEQTTMVERAEAKAERLDDLAVKRANQANSFSAAAHRISERFAGGQPILIGHHSEGKARRDQQKMDNLTRQAVEAYNSIQHWQWKAEGVEQHANHKANPVVRARRIKTLLADLRDHQRDLNHAQICLELWTKISQETDQEQFEKVVSHYVGGHIASGPASSYKQRYALENGEMTHREVVDSNIESFEKLSNSRHTIRWINHILNRLGYERYELGEVSRFDGVLTAAILQIFTRTHGAHKPKATKSEGGWAVASSVPLPLHIGEGKELELSDSDWCDLMQAVGYEVPAPKPKAAPILNFKAGSIQAVSWGNERIFNQLAMTKAEYQAIYSDHRGVRLSKCGQFRFKMCKHPEQTGYAADWVCVFLTDSKIHETPVSDSIKQVEEA